MKRLTPLLIVVLVVLSGCASSLPPQLSATMREACALYQEARPVIVKYRAWAIDHWDEVPDELKDTLIRFDSYLPELDRAGELVCMASTDLLTTSASRRVDWDQVLSTTVAVAAKALELSKAGVI